MPPLPRSHERPSFAMDDAGHGFDAFGMSRASVEQTLRWTRFLYEHWFRVDSRGAEQLPSTGPVILAANHSGMLPLDAVMLWADVLRSAPTPRVVRMVADVFVPRLPFVFTAFSRVGAVAGTRANLEALLGRGEVVGIFPEGTPGIGKPRERRYQLEPFRTGHIELALRFGAPIVPVGIVGAEEQWPELARLERLHPFGAPYLPIPFSPIPLPVHYHVRYGAPIQLASRARQNESADPTTVREMADGVRRAVQSLVDEMLRERCGVFS